MSDGPEVDYKKLFDECAEARDAAGFLGSLPECIQYLSGENADQAAEIERLTVGQPIETAQPGQQMLAWEANYGWLIVSKQKDGSFLQKSSGNFWMEVPASVQFTHWLPYPGFLKERG